MLSEPEAFDKLLTIMAMLAKKNKWEATESYLNRALEAVKWEADESTRIALSSKIQGTKIHVEEKEN